MNIVKAHLQTTKLHLRRAKFTYHQLKQLNIDKNLFNNQEQIKTIDAFIFRFIKIQDFMGEKLFKSFLDSIGEYNDSMSLLDVLDRMEKLRIIHNADDWMNYRKIRNKLTHEYPHNQDEIIEGIKIALSIFNKIEEIVNIIENYRGV